VKRAVTPAAVNRERRALHPAGKAKLTFGGMETIRSTTGALRLQRGAGTAKNPYTR